MIDCNVFLLHNIMISFFFFFNDTATTEIYTLSLHDALPIYADHKHCHRWLSGQWCFRRSEEHTSELQSRLHLVCRLLLEKKKRNNGSQVQKTRALMQKTLTTTTMQNLPTATAQRSTTEATLV